MATSLGELWIRIGLRGTSEVVSGLQQVGSSASSLSNQTENLDKNTKNLSDRFSNATGQALAFAGSMVVIARVVGQISGINLASKYQATEAGLRNMLGSAEKARQLMSDLKQMGTQTPYRTEELVGFSRRLLATGSNASDVVKQLQTLSNVGANMGLPVGEVGEMVDLLGRLRIQAHAGAETFAALSARGVKLSEVLKASRGVEFKGKYAEMQSAQYLGALPGAEAFKVIMDGLQKLNSTANTGNFVSVLQNTMEQINLIMEPTGRLLITVLSPVLRSVQNMASMLGSLNAFTFGLAGLPIAFGVAVVAVNSARNAILVLSGALNVLRNSALSASTATGMNAGANTLGGLGNIAGLGRFAGLGGKLLKGGMAGLGISGGISLLGMLLPDKLKPLVDNVSAGAGLGATAGSVIPGLGTATGAILGTIFGGVKTIYETFQSRASGNNPLLEETKKTNEILSDMNGKIYGAGRRSDIAVSSIEAEIGLARRLAMGGM